MIVGSQCSSEFIGAHRSSSELIGSCLRTTSSRRPGTGAETSQMNFREIAGSLGAGLLVGAFSFHSMASWANAPDASKRAVKSRDPGSTSVLLIGNSHLLMPGFMKRVEARVRSIRGQPATFRVVAKIGTTLTKSRKRAATLAALRSSKWDVIVLQESTTAFMTNHGRRNFASAIKWFDARKPKSAKLLLWQTWPQGSSHALYHRRGVWGRWFKNPPRNPTQLFSWIEAGVRGAATAHRAYIAPIGRCWMKLSPRKRPYAQDDYHPSNRGLTFIANILARSIVATAADTDAAPGAVIGKCS